MYGKQTECMQRISNLPIQNQLKAIDSAGKFGLNELTTRIIDLISEQINCKTCIPVFIYACNANNEQLLQIVEPFILQNLQELVSTQESNQQELIVELNQKFQLLTRLSNYLIKNFRLIYSNPQTLQVIQKF